MPNLGSAKCGRNCFECSFSDCIVDDITSEERKDMHRRDVEAYERDDSKKYRHTLEQTRRYKAKRKLNPESVAKDKATKQAYYRNHLEEIKEQQKAYVDANREQVRARQKAWHQAHPDKAREYSRRYEEKKKKEKMECVMQILNTQIHTMGLE